MRGLPDFVARAVALVLCNTRVTLGLAKPHVGVAQFRLGIAQFRLGVAERAAAHLAALARVRQRCSGLLSGGMRRLVCGTACRHGRDIGYSEIESACFRNIREAAAS